MDQHTRFDWARADRTGVPEAIYAEGKTAGQIVDTLNDADARGQPVLLTRLSPEQAHAITASGLTLTYHPLSRVGVFGSPAAAAPDAPSVGIVAAGTTDLPVAEESEKSSAFFGLKPVVYADVGVAGVWRLENIVADLRTHPLLIAVAGMEAALFSVLAGLLPTPIIAVPTSVGYGVAAGGTLALHAALGGCAPGVVTVNIDNGFGAAAAAKKILGTMDRAKPAEGRP